VHTGQQVHAFKLCCAILWCMRQKRLKPPSENPGSAPECGKLAFSHAGRVGGREVESVGRTWGARVTCELTHWGQRPLVVWTHILIVV
jgi:hypothetical protein